MHKPTNIQTYKRMACINIKRFLSHRGYRLDWRGVDKGHPLISLAIALHHLRHALASQSSSAHPIQASSNCQFDMCRLALLLFSARGPRLTALAQYCTQHRCCAAWVRMHPSTAQTVASPFPGIRVKRKVPAPCAARPLTERTCSTHCGARHLGPGGTGSPAGNLTSVVSRLEHHPAGTPACTNWSLCTPGQHGESRCVRPRAHVGAPHNDGLPRAQVGGHHHPLAPVCRQKQATMLSAS